MVRLPAVAGSFYPAKPDSLRRLVERLLAQVPPLGNGRPLVALIVPHAGYEYSGPVAAYAYRALAEHNREFKRIVVIGPSHFVHFSGIAAPRSAVFATPLGEIAVDVETLRNLADVDILVIDDEPHRREHSIEVQLPFLQMVLEDFVLVPLAVGDCDPTKISHLIDRLWDDPQTLIIVSSDLSHYLSYEEAQRKDRATARAIEALEAESLGPEDACGFLPIAGLLLAVKRYPVEVARLDMRNSGDTAGMYDWVVGYGAWAFYKRSAGRNGVLI